MKKIILGVLFIGVILLNVKKTNDDIVIPNDAIRFRIIAKDNSIENQALKNQIKNEIMAYFKNNNYDKMSKKELISHLSNNSELSSIISKYTSDYDINYGINHFPKKGFKGILYNEGEYLSLVITLGEGKGDNWWCVIYPPLCFIDENNPEYKSLIKEIVS